MAYSTSDLEKKALKAIKEHNLVFTDEVFVFCGCSRRCYYDHKVHELHTIKDALEENKINTKLALRKKWRDSDNATVQIALYKLIGTDEESDRINSQKTNIGGGMEIVVKRPDTKNE